MAISIVFSVSLMCSQCPNWLKRGTKPYPHFVGRGRSKGGITRIDCILGNRVAVVAVQSFTPRYDLEVADHLPLEVQLDVSIFSVKQRRNPVDSFQWTSRK